MPVWMIVFYALFSATVLFAVFSLIRRHEKQTAKTALYSYLLLTAVFFAIWIWRLFIPPLLLVFAIIAVFINIFFGYYLNRFNRSKVFDRYLHAYGSFSCALLTFSLVRNLFETGGSTAYSALVIASLGMALGSIFELVEAAADKKQGTSNQRGLQDTNMDMLGNLIGSVVAGVFWYWFMA